MLTKSNYFDAKDSKIDPKAIQNEIDQLQKEFDLLRETFRAGLGDRPISMRLSTPFTITTTVTTGVTKTVNINGTASANLDPTQCSEWATMKAIFDEYKVHGGQCVFNYNNPTTASITGSINSDSLPVMGYDGGAGGASATSSISLTQLSEHKILPTSGQGGTTTASFVCGMQHRFRWHTPHGTVLGISGSNGLPTDAWLITDNPASAGTLQFYHVGTCVTAIDSGAGIIYFDMQFRCRQ